MRPILFADWGGDFKYGVLEPFFQKHCFSFGLILCAFVIFIRNPEALLRSEFWGEDLTEFFIGAIHLGASSLVTPVFGYQFFFERVFRVRWFAVCATDRDDDEAIGGAGNAWILDDPRSGYRTWCACKGPEN